MKKLLLINSCLVFFSPLFFITTNAWAQPCLDNDDCEQAIDIPNIISDSPFVCIQGCNLFASPEDFSTYCSNENFPTVWYKVTVDDEANLINVFVNSSDFDSPTISAFESETGCDSLTILPLTSSNLHCLIGSNGEASALGTSVSANHTYYFAISSFNSIGGDFELCINAISSGSACVVDRNIQVTSRSNGGPLEGPFDPAEKVSFCLNINEYTAAGNGCQWFQGIVPVFGNGWDPSSFDNNGQPLNATINGNAIGLDGNGLYGASTWDWFNDIDYHYNNSALTIDDFDGNGTIDICNSKYEMDCPQVGVQGGCCGPCWGDTIGTILPPGWFAYGINGTCPDTSGPGVDWGDGNTCGAGMGPWSFCFDLTTRDVPDCMGDSTKRDLTVGYFTFADGETGAWTGSASVCALDRPMKISLQAKCGRISMNSTEELLPLCSGDTLRYKVYDPNVTQWDWNISPFSAVPYTTNHGVNGFEIEAPLINNTDEPINVTGVFIGHVKSSNDLFIQNIEFTLHNAESCVTSINTPIDKNIKKDIRIYPTPANESAILEWTVALKRDAQVHIYDMDGNLVNSIPVSTHDGYQKRIDIQAFEPGVYLVSLSNSDIRSVAKLVKL